MATSHPRNNRHNRSVRAADASTSHNVRFTNGESSTRTRERGRVAGGLFVPLRDGTAATAAAALVERGGREEEGSYVASTLVFSNTDESRVASGLTCCGKSAGSLSLRVK